MVTVLHFHFHSHFHGSNPTLRRTTTKTVNALWPGNPCALAKFTFFILHGCQNSFRSSDQGLRWSDWNHVLLRCKLFDSLYSRPSFNLCLFAYFYLLFFSNLQCNMLKNYPFLFNTFDCCLPFLRAKKAWTCLTPVSFAWRAEIIGSLLYAAG